MKRHGISAPIYDYFHMHGATAVFTVHREILPAKLLVYDRFLWLTTEMALK